jgi:hypothetical protein
MTLRNTRTTEEIARWKPFEILIIARYLRGELTEGQLARKLGTDRLDARRQLSAFLDWAIGEASVPIERISGLEQRAATLSARVARLELERTELENALYVQRQETQRQVLRAEALRAALRDYRENCTCGLDSPLIPGETP